MCSNIPASPAYDVYISQLIRYARASSNYSDFLKRHLHLRNRLLNQGYPKIRLILLKSLYSDTKILSKYIPSLQKKLSTMDFHIVKMYKAKVSTKMSIFFLSMCDVKVSLTFTSLSVVLLWQLFYLFCSSIVINTVIVTAGNFEP
jgi:hypothetical protein